MGLNIRFDWFLFHFVFSYAVLPGLLSSVLAKLVEHVTKQCSVCQDTGEWCGAGILCEDSFSPIYPFQVLKKSFINWEIIHT